MSKNSVNLEEQILPTAVGFQAMTVTGNKELGVQPYLYEPKTNNEGNANIMVLFYEITELSKFWSFKKTQNKRRHNEKGLMFLCLSCQDINSGTMFLLMQKIMTCFHAVNTETVSIV